MLFQFCFRKKFHHRAKELMIMSQSIRDAGRTQISPGTKTVVGFGPGKIIELIHELYYYSFAIIIFLC